MKGKGVITLVLLAVLILAGCGGGGPPPATPTPTPTPTIAPTPTPTLTPVPIARVRVQGRAQAWEPLLPPMKDITYPHPFTEAPVVVVNAGVDAKPKIAWAKDITKNNFNLAVIADDGTTVTSAMVRWVAVPGGVSKLDLGGGVAIQREHDSHNISDIVSFPWAFDSTPAVVNNAYSAAEPYIPYALNITASRFVAMFIDDDGDSPHSAWLHTIAVGPGEPDPDLLIQAGRDQRIGDGDFIDFPQSFSEAPVVIINAATMDGVPAIASAVEQSSGGFFLSILDHEGNPVDKAQVQWIAVGRE